MTPPGAAAGPPPDVPGLPQAGEVLGGRIALQRVIGIGGMGCVMAAQHLTLGTPVAVKFMRPALARDLESVTRFVREARAAVRIRSEHVVRIMDVATLPSGVPYIVMEHLDGCNLDEFVSESGPLPVADAVGYLLQAGDAIAEAHALGIVHRDLKPGNLFLTHRPGGAPLVKVLDFGISKVGHLFEGNPDTESLTRVNVAMGSPLFMSPEQLRDAKGVDRRTDLWALGAIAYYLLTGLPPFVATGMLQLLDIVANGPPPPLRVRRPDVPPELEAVIHSCLESDRARRIATVAALARALAPFAPADDVALVERIQRTADEEAPATLVGAAPAPAPEATAPAAAGADPFEGARTSPLVGDRTAVSTPAFATTQPGAAAPPPAAPHDTQPQPRRPAVIVAGAALVAVVAGVALALALRGPATERPSPTAARPAAPGEADGGFARAAAPAVDAAPTAPATAPRPEPATPPPATLRPLRPPRPGKAPAKGRTKAPPMIFDDALKRRK
jgi:eukaryotic-like serine/threonine-protein kinase